MFDQNGTSDLKIVIIRDREGLYGILEAWKELQNQEKQPIPNVDPDHYLYELESMSECADPYILCAYSDGKAETMLIGRSQSVTMTCRLGYLTLMKPCLKGIHFHHNGLLGKRNRSVCRVLLKTLKKSLSANDADVAIFNHIPLNSAMHDVIRDEIHLLLQGHFPKVERHWRMQIPECMNDFYSGLSRKHRGNLKRQVRRLDSSHQVSLRLFVGKDDLEDIIAVVAHLSSKTYQHAIGYGFADNPQNRKYISLAARRGWLRLHVLFIDSEAAAFQFAMHYKGTYFLRQIAYDPMWQQWGIGSILFIKVLELMCKEPDVRYLDFGYGDAQYKKSYGDSYTDEVSISVFAKRLRPVFVNIIRTLTLAILNAATRLAGKLQIERKLKRLWRNRLRRFGSRGVKGKTTNHRSS